MKRKAPTGGFKYPKRKYIKKGPPGQYVGKRAMVPYRGSVTEKKTYDIDTAVYQVNTTGSFTLLCIPVTGADFTNRVGRKIYIDSVYIRGQVRTEAAAATAAVAVPPILARMIIFVDHQPNAATPAVTDLLKEALSQSQLNLNNRDRFTICCDKYFQLGFYAYNTTATTSNATGDNQAFSIRKYKKVKVETIFNATNGGSIADITSGALYMFWIGNTAAGANTDANASVSTRVRFRDA